MNILKMWHVMGADATKSHTFNPLAKMAGTIITYPVPEISDKLNL